MDKNENGVNSEKKFYILLCLSMLGVCFEGGGAAAVTAREF